MRRSTALRILPSFASEIIVFAGYRHPLAGKYPPIMHEKTLKRLLYLYLETPAPGDVLRVYGKPRNTTLRQVLATAEWDVQDIIFHVQGILLHLHQGEELSTTFPSLESAPGSER